MMLSIIVPAYNEEENLPELMRGIDTFAKDNCDIEVLIVSDHSTDSTLQVGLKLKEFYPYMRIIDNLDARGMGSAIKTGIGVAMGAYVVFVMADNTCPLEVVIPMLRIMRIENLDMLIYSRYGRKDDSRGIPLRYKFCSYLFNLTAEACLGIRLTDPTDAFRMVRKDFYRTLNVTRNDFSFSAETTVRAWAAGGRISEYFGSQKLRVRGKSSFSFRKMAWPYASLILEEMQRDLKRYLG